MAVKHWGNMLCLSIGLYLVASVFLSGVCLITSVMGQMPSSLQLQKVINGPLTVSPRFEGSGQKSGILPQGFLHTVEYQSFQAARGL